MAVKECDKMGLHGTGYAANRVSLKFLGKHNNLQCTLGYSVLNNVTVDIGIFEDVETFNIQSSLCIFYLRLGSFELQLLYGKTYNQGLLWCDRIVHGDDDGEDEGNGEDIGDGDDVVVDEEIDM